MAAPARTTTELDERDAFTRLMERAGVKHRVRLASGARGRGLFPSGPVGWGKSAVLLSVPLDVCIVAPFGDAAAAGAGAGGVSAAVAEELGFSKDPEGEKAKKDTYGILRAAWEKRAGVTLPETITSLSRSGDGADRELAVALWVLFATRSGDAERNVWRAYAEWLPTAEELPSLMLANDKELDQLQDEALKREAKATQNAADALFLSKKNQNTETDGSASDFFVIRDGLEVTAEDARWAFALVASRALASPVGDDGSSDFAAILTPFFDMANSDDVSLVSASKSVRGTADADVENAARVVLERGLNQGVGGPRVVLETTRGLESADAEILISYDPTATNAELMLRYGFSLRGNRNERLPGPSGSIREDAKTAKTRKPSFLESEILRFALEETGLMTEETSAEERRRLFVAVASACGGFGNPEEDQGEWELDDAQVRLEIACAEAFVDAWTKQLRSFDTDLKQDEAALTAAQTGSLPGATPRIVAAVEYRAERKRCLETGVRALRAYVEWLQEEEEEEESAGGFVDQQE